MHLAGNRPGETVVHKSNVPVEVKGPNEIALGALVLMSTSENFKKCWKIRIFGEFLVFASCIVFTVHIRMRVEVRIQRTPLGKGRRDQGNLTIFVAPATVWAWPLGPSLSLQTRPA